MRAGVTIVTALVATLDLACVSGPQLRDPQARIAAKRLAALPTQGRIFVVGPRGGRDADKELSATVRKNVDDSINYRVHQHGGHVFGNAATAKLEHFIEFHNWSWRAMHEIVAERLGKVPAAHRSVAEWRFPGDLKSWRPVLSSDFLLVSFVLYVWRPPELQWPSLAVAIAEMAKESKDPPDSMSITGAGSRMIACVVAIDDGHIVWCNFIPNNSVTMQERPAAQSAVDVLLSDMLRLADGVP
ncbi:MAG TPA: hypothetical protein VGP64_03830 [Polyangia bacterium]|jgi:hypothetical protein